MGHLGSGYIVFLKGGAALSYELEEASGVCVVGA